jgi:hypothetical protein
MPKQYTLSIDLSEEGSKKLPELVRAILFADPVAYLDITEVGGDEAYERFEDTIERMHFDARLKRLKAMAKALVRLLEEYGPTDYERLLSRAARRHGTGINQFKYGFSYAKKEKLIVMSCENPSLVLLPSDEAVVS